MSVPMELFGRFCQCFHCQFVHWRQYPPKITCTLRPDQNCEFFVRKTDGVARVQVLESGRHSGVSCGAQRPNDGTKRHSAFPNWFGLSSSSHARSTLPQMLWPYKRQRIGDDSGIVVCCTHFLSPLVTSRSISLSCLKRGMWFTINRTPV